MSLIVLKKPLTTLTGPWLNLTGPDNPKVSLRCLKLPQLDTYFLIEIRIIYLSIYLCIRNKISIVYYIFVYQKLPFCFTNISGPCNRTEMVLYSKFAYWSQCSEEEKTIYKFWNSWQVTTKLVRQENSCVFKAPAKSFNT